MGISPTKPRWTRSQRTRSALPTPPATFLANSAVLRAEDLVAVAEPINATIRLPAVGSADHTRARATIRRALGGLNDPQPESPDWLLPHQKTGLARVRAILACFSGGFLADATGLGKTYIALALTQSYRNSLVIAPASILPQWKALADRLSIAIRLISHESLSRGNAPPPCDLIIVDEAHRFRNPTTIRYAQLACAIGAAKILLVTATPIVNTARDVVALLRLFLSDNALALYGVPSLSAEHPAPSPALSAVLHLLTVHRTWECVHLPRLQRPRVTDEPVVRLPAIPPAALSGVVKQMCDLRFPGFGAHPVARALLSRHLLLRLASSAEAALETLTRHRAYLRRATDAALRGETISRPAARRLFSGWDDRQLDLLGGLTETSATVSAQEFDDEARRLERLTAVLQRHLQHSPKRRHLLDLLAHRGAARTIVFSSSVATATALAESAGWKRVAVATGRGARIASGPIDLQTVLDLFSPESRGQPAPNCREDIFALIATDLVSEGLNLQDADGIVHYDIPWTPVRLQQRLGRIARLGSRHAVARTWWFGPPTILEDRLQLTERVLQKAELTGRLSGVPSSIVGVGELEAGGKSRERLAEFGAWPSPAVQCSIVNGSRQAVFAVEWLVDQQPIPDVLVLADEHWILGAREQMAIIQELLGASVSERKVETGSLQTQFTKEIKKRLLAARRGPRDAHTRQLSQQILRFARTAGRARDMRTIDRLNDVLDRIAPGVPIGALRSLDAVLEAVDPDNLNRWCKYWPARLPVSFGARLRGVIIGDGGPC